MPRPREQHVLTEDGECPVHGEVRLRIHQVGYLASGRPKFRKRCPQCHADRNRDGAARYAKNRRSRAGARR